jgi:hypothetical protein
MKLMHMPQVSDSGEPSEHSLNALTRVAFPIALQGRHSQTVISELNTAPIHTPTNASPRHHWSSRHSLGPERIATPFSVADLTLKPHYLLHAGFNRRFQSVPLPYLSWPDLIFSFWGKRKRPPSHTRSQSRLPQIHFCYLKISPFLHIAARLSF